MNYKNLFYFDIETVGQYKDIETLRDNDERGYLLFHKKYVQNTWMHERHNTVNDAYLNYSPIFSTYGKIVCVSFGYYHDRNNKGYSILSIVNDDEEKLIKEVSELFEKVSKKTLILSGYRINNFDIPWLVHKMNKYNIDVPPILSIYGKKPWEIRSFDLADQWKFGFKYYSSFDEVCYELGIESPKDEIDGSMVHDTYWNEKDLDKIKNYCEKDILASMEVAEKMIKYHTS